jgi:hypothetical protein
VAATTRILQNGGRVILIGGSRQPVVALTVSPRGFIFWNARSLGGFADPLSSRLRRACPGDP